jgi:Sulfotransferase family
MNSAELLDVAVERATLDDFGPDGFREGFEILVSSLDDEAQLSEIGVAALTEQVVGALVNRLRVVDAHRRDPALASGAVGRPFVVLGLPRTGTTFLSYLLDCDPANRSLMRWEATNSLPPPRTETFTTDPRIDETRAGQAMIDSLNPEFKAMHYEAPDGPTECVTVLAQDFKSLLWETVANVPSYGEWLLDGCDHTSAYEYHRSVLQVLQSEAPGRWSLKTPHHCLALDTLLETYPDACLVMTHRDPVTVTASTCSLVRSLSGTFSDGDHRSYINERFPRIFDVAMSRVSEFRDRRPDIKWCDVAYADLVRDPAGTVGRIYDTFDDELSADAEQRMAAYAAANPKGAHGQHSYDAESLGLDVDALRKRFEPYTDRFGVLAGAATS